MRVRIIFLALTLLTADAQAPWYGAWKLNPAKSTTNSESRYKRVLLRIDPLEDGMSVVYDMVGTRGGITHMEWIGKLDGKDYPVQGLDYVLTNAYTRLNDRSYRIVIKVDGALAATAEVLRKTREAKTSRARRFMRGLLIDHIPVDDILG
jgi:hypothetical protein